MFELVFDDEAIDFLNNLSITHKKRLFNKLVDTKKDPFHFFEKLLGRLEFKLRVGDYGIIPDLNENDKTIHVLCIGHRRNVYKQH